MSPHLNWQVPIQFHFHRSPHKSMKALEGAAPSDGGRPLHLRVFRHLGYSGGSWEMVLLGMFSFEGNRKKPRDNQYYFSHSRGPRSICMCVCMQPYLYSTNLAKRQQSSDNEQVSKDDTDIAEGNWQLSYSQQRCTVPWIPLVASWRSLIYAGCCPSNTGLCSTMQSVYMQDSNQLKLQAWTSNIFRLFLSCENGWMWNPFQTSKQ